ncbi:MAG: hypothetical protein ACREFO_14390, partial [Acetobacteraceae bacterium]
LALLAGFVAPALITAHIPAAASSHRTDWFPAAVGTQWTYEHVALDVASPKRVQWTTVETIVGERQIPEGIVILRKVERTGPGPNVTGYKAFWNYGDWLIHDGCAYPLADPGEDNTFVRYGWNSSTGKLSPGYVDALLRGYLHPWVCYPLTVGRIWKSDNDPNLISRVEGTGNPGPFTLGSPLSRWSTDAVRVLEFNIQGRAYVWFRTGAGVTDLRYAHAGTFGEYIVTLKNFKLGDSNSVRGGL